MTFFWTWETNSFKSPAVNSCAFQLPWKKHEKNKTMQKHYYPVLRPWSSSWGINTRMRDREVQFFHCGTYYPVTPKLTFSRLWQQHLERDALYQPSENKAQRADSEIIWKQPKGSAKDHAVLMQAMVGTPYSKTEEIVGIWGSVGSQECFLISKREFRCVIYHFMEVLFSNKFHSCITVLVEGNTTPFCFISVLFSAYHSLEIWFY